ncbi:TPA: hypothetical protein EYP66_05545 [Candidatus Poribacteria bacterium]|nr:hypothetical protein [Candidatus Poribacteria bacterium]
MIRNELELQVSFEAIVKARKIRERCMEAIPESEMRNDVIEGIDIQIRKIEDEIFEYLAKRKERKSAAN